MKNYRSIRWIAAVFLFSLVAVSASAQESKIYISNKISFNVPFGPVYPIEGESTLVDGKMELDDDTGQLKKVSFDVPLNSFFGQNSEYLGWIGNNWQNPDLSFSGRSVTHNADDSLTVSGSLRFRRQSSPIRINFTKKVVGNQIVLQGKFDLRTGEYFIGRLNRRVVPMRIPFEVTMVFDKPEGLNDNLISFHSSEDLFIEESI